MCQYSTTGHGPGLAQAWAKSMVFKRTLKTVEDKVLQIPTDEQLFPKAVICTQFSLGRCLFL